MLKKFFVSIIVFFVFATPSLADAEVLNHTNILDRYAAGGPLKILVVPGHSDLYPGAVYGKIREADMTRQLGAKIVAELSKDPRLSATLLRDENGYKPEFLNYYLTKTAEVDDFMNSHIKSTQKAVESGEIKVSSQAAHNPVPDDIVNKLYAISKWAGEQGYDMVLNLHFNDNWPRALSARGPYAGYSVYVPETGLSNAVEGQALGRAIAARLENSIDKSDLPGEMRETDATGVIESFKLIAIGAYNTLDIPSVVVEHSYIYEPWLDPQFFPLATNVLARAVSSGVEDYILGARVDKKNLIYQWNTDIAMSESKTTDTLALQLALSEMGFYPPVGKTRDDCAMTGIFWNCTRDALKAFQSARAIKPTGTFGPITRGVMNILFAY